ncbi:MAG: hypothetical protein LUI05_04200 [Oscillospiraceae bacterium]|nr:hypothetical protein [Oscillospiraceae bacterium]
MDNQIYYLAIMSAIISFLGFVLEDVWLAFRKGFIDNRNMTFPLLFGYGLFIISFYLIIGTPEAFILMGAKKLRSSAARYVTYFLMTFLIVSVGEIVLGKITEWYFGFSYWNYEKIPLHVTKYTSIPTSIGFSLIITSFMGKCFVPILSIVKRIPIGIARVIAIASTVIMVSDMIVSFGKMHRTHELNIRHVIPIRKSLRLAKASDKE